MTKPTNERQAGAASPWQRPDGRPRAASGEPAAEGGRTTGHRVRMSGNRSASTRGPVRELDRVRARRRRLRPFRRRFAAAALGVLLIVGVCLGVGWFRQQREIHEFDAYPLRYTAEVEAAAGEFDLEPAYLYAVILAESSFHPDAVSSVGALGLMQVMPDTGEWIAGKLNLSESYSVDMLTDPALNVRFGSWYLRFLLDRYGGDKRCASAAYHAGQGTVDAWLANPSLSPDGHTLSAIAYDSTDHYVNKVLKNYEKYLALLSQGA